MFSPVNARPRTEGGVSGRGTGRTVAPDTVGSTTPGSITRGATTGGATVRGAAPAVCVGIGVPARAGAALAIRGVDQIRPTAAPAIPARRTNSRRPSALPPRPDMPTQSPAISPITLMPSPVIGQTQGFTELAA